LQFFKGRVRVLSTLIEHYDKFGKVPSRLKRGFDAYLKFKYATGDRIIDGVEISNEPIDPLGDKVRQLLSEGGREAALKEAELWGKDLSFLA